MIRRGDADAMIAGGSEAAITPMGVGGFAAMRALSTRNDEPERASRPFDKDRDGFVIGEGAGVLVLEELELGPGARRAHLRRGRGLRRLGATRSTSPPRARTATAPCARCRRRCSSAGVRPSAVDYINAHGTSTPLNDRLETLAIKRCFGDHARTVAVSSTKSMTGHTARRGRRRSRAGSPRWPSTTRWCRRRSTSRHPDPECDLDYVPNACRAGSITYALSNSFGFGGTNASLLLRRSEE